MLRTFEIIDGEMGNRPVKLYHVPGVKRPGREVNQSRPCSSAIKNEWSYTFSLPRRLCDARREGVTFDHATLYRIPSCKSA